MVLFVVGSFSLLQAENNYATPYAFTTLAGSARAKGSTDGTGSAARFYELTGVAVDGSGNVYIADEGNNTIRKISPGAVVTTLAGTAGQSGSNDGSGSAASFNGPTGVAVDGSGNLYVADFFNDTIRKISPGGVVTTLAGSPGQAGSADGSGSAARFHSPFSVAVDGSGNIYAADFGNDTIREITASGVVTTLAGKAGQAGSSDGTGSAALFKTPEGVAVDTSGNLYVVDTGNDTVRKIAPGGAVTTLAWTAGQYGSSDGTGAAALFHTPISVAVDGSGNVYVSDASNEIIRQITPGGMVVTMAGSAGAIGSNDGTASLARFDMPWGLAVDNTGKVYVADEANDTVRAGTSEASLLNDTVANANVDLSPWFGYYSPIAYPLLYHYNLGYEYVFDAGNGGAYLFDYKSGHFWYTQASYYPFIYDFTLGTYLYYYTSNANGAPRYFYDYGTNQVISE